MLFTCPKHIHSVENSPYKNSGGSLSKSWREINALNQTIIFLHQNGTSIQPSILHGRNILAKQHFRKHPIGPATANFYQNKLANYFDQEEIIIQIQQQQKHNPLRLVN